MEALKQHPIRLTLESHGKKVTIECDSSEIGFDEMIEMIKGVLYASGWAKETIDKYIQ